MAIKECRLALNSEFWFMSDNSGYCILLFGGKTVIDDVKIRVGDRA